MSKAIEHANDISIIVNVATIRPNIEFNKCHN
jgi:hypothetical protein